MDNALRSFVSCCRGHDLHPPVVVEDAHCIAFTQISKQIFILLPGYVIDTQHCSGWQVFNSSEVIGGSDAHREDSLSPLLCPDATTALVFVASGPLSSRAIAGDSGFRVSF